MILLILVFSIVAAIASKKILQLLFGKSLPVETLKMKLKDCGYTYKSNKKIEENSLPQNIEFNQLWSFLRFIYKKSYYQIVVTNDLEKNEEILYLKYYQTLSPFLNDKYYFKNIGN